MGISFPGPGAYATDAAIRAKARSPVFTMHGGGKKDDRIALDQGSLKYNGQPGPNAYRPGPPGAATRPSRSLAIPIANQFCMALLYGRAGAPNRPKWRVSLPAVPTGPDDIGTASYISPFGRAARMEPDNPNGIIAVPGPGAHRCAVSAL